MAIEIYTDGASTRINQKATEEVPIFKAGWAITWLYKGKRFTRYGFLPPPSSSNRGELTGVIEALKIASKIEAEIFIYTDSQYCSKSMNEWYPKWIRENKTDIKNPDLMKEAYDLFSKIKHRVTIKWVKGHNGLEGNEVADEYAVNGKNEVIVESSSFHTIKYISGF